MQHAKNLCCEFVVCYGVWEQVYTKVDVFMYLGRYSAFSIYKSQWHGGICNFGQV